MTHAQKWTQLVSRGRWRKARVQHECSKFFDRVCHGLGQIQSGDRYFDTEELMGVWATHKVCISCANRDSSIPPTPKEAQSCG